MLFQVAAFVNTGQLLRFLTQQPPSVWGIAAHPLQLFETKEIVSENVQKEDPHNFEIWTLQRALEEYLWDEVCVAVFL